MKSFKDYVSEKWGDNNGGLTIFDIDDTLFHTTAEIAVKGKDGKIVRTLSNSEYNTYKLKDGEEYDYTEFADSEKFFKESNGNKFNCLQLTNFAKIILCELQTSDQSNGIGDKNGGTTYAEGKANSSGY